MTDKITAALALVGTPRIVCACGRKHGVPHTVYSAGQKLGLSAPEQQALYRRHKKLKKGV